MKWTKAMREATPAQFRRLISNCRPGQVQNAIAAGRSLGRILDNASLLVMGVDDLQLERYRRRFGVPRNLRMVMLAVAQRRINLSMLAKRLDRKFPSHRLLSGKLRMVDRCLLCAKHVCRCVGSLVPKEKSSAKPSATANRMRTNRRAESPDGRGVERRVQPTKVHSRRLQGAANLSLGSRIGKVVSLRGIPTVNGGR